MTDYPRANRRSGLAWSCVVIVLLAALLIWPVVESGVIDDWSIARTAQVLADTGHIQFNGWEAPMLGWMLFIPLLPIKIIGFSYTLVRGTMLLLALGTVFLLQRTFVRAGLSEPMATFGTLVVALSPIFLISSVTFMSDIPGLLSVVLCLYACLRAVQSPVARNAARWVVFAALSNAVLGSARQIAWLGLLTIVPAAIFLLRRSRPVLFAGIAAWLVGLCIIVVSMRWLAHQPYVLPEHLLIAWPRRDQFDIGLGFLLEIFFDLILLMLPIALALFPIFRRAGASIYYRTALPLAALGLLIWLLARHGRFMNLLAPFLLYYEAPPTNENAFLSFHMPMLGNSPAPLNHGLRLTMTIVMAVGLLAVVVGVVGYKRIRRQVAEQVPSSPWYNTLILVGPFVLAYLAAVMPRAVFLLCVVDRYLLLLLPPVALLLLLFLQNLCGSRVSAFAFALLVPFGLYGIFTLHDEFATYRANLTGIEEVQAAGIARTSIDGGFEYNHTTQLLIQGYVYQPGIRLPDGSFLQGTRLPNGPCLGWFMEHAPTVRPLYGIAFEDNGCVVAKGFAPINYRTWLPPFQRQLEVVEYGHEAKRSRNIARDPN